MAARAIIGIAIGILFAPIIYMLLFGIAFIGSGWTPFSEWWWTLFGSGDFMTWINDWMMWGQLSMVAPIMGAGGLIEGFGAGALLTDFAAFYAPALFTWAIVGMWAGAIERSPGRGIGVAVGVWLGWFIIILIMMLIGGGIGGLVDFLLASLLTLIVAILAGLVFGAMTKSEEF